MSELTAFSYDLLRNLGLQLTYTTIVFLLCLPAIYYFRERNPFLVTCLCWLVLCRLVVPVDIASPLSLRALIDMFSSTQGHDLNFVATEAAHNGPPLLPAENSLSLVEALAPVLLLIWLAGAGFNYFRVLRQRFRLLQIARTAETGVPGGMQTSFNYWLDELNIKRQVRLVVSDKVNFIFTIGTWQPFVVLPRQVVDNAHSRDLDIILAHELGHIARRDDLAIQVMLLLRSVFFFYPIVWVCLYFLSVAREQLCDKRVLERNRFEPADYGRSLLDVIGLQHARTAPSCVAGFTGKKALQARLKFCFSAQVTRKTQPFRYIALFAALAVVLLPLAAGTHANNPAVGGFASPVVGGRVSSEFGFRNNPLDKEGKRHFHKGIDIMGARNQPVYAVADGEVIEAEEYVATEMPNWGNYIVVRHANGLVSRYMHLDTVKASVGERVTGGQQIGAMGDSGLATGVHLHFELLRGQEPVDPREYVDIR